MLEFALGKRNCSSGVVVTSTNSLAMAFFATLLFVLFTLPGVNAWFTSIIPNPSYRIIFQALVFFLIIFLLDRWLESWRTTHPICR